jgi:hypothetical protein
MGEQVKHTPGPWAIRPNAFDDWGVVRAANGNLVAVARAGEHLTEDQYAEHRRVGTDPYGHNARLIAAAPDMLAALKMLATDNEDAMKFSDRMNMAAAAIAKAEGRAP